MAQPGQERIVTTPSGDIIIRPDGTFQAVPRTTPTAPLTPSPDAARTNLTAQNPRGFVSDLLRAGGAASSFLPGYGPAASAARVGIPSISEVIASFAEGDTTGEALKGGATDIMLGVGGEAASRLIPALFTRLALASGGAVGRLSGREISNTASAYNREAERNWVPHLVGNSVDAAKKEQGAILQASEFASPHTAKANDLLISAGKEPTRTPVTRIESIADFNQQTIIEQAIDKAGLTRAQWNQLPAVQKVQIIDNMEFNTRELGELQRGTYREARPAIEATKQGAPSYMTPQNARNSEDLVDTLRGLRHGRHDVGTPQTIGQRFMGSQPQPGQTGAIKEADARLHDLNAIKTAVERMQSPDFYAGTGAIGGRAFIGNMLGRAVGVDPTLSSIGAIFGLDPRVLSALGFMGGKYATPSALAYERVNKTRERKP